ncbi:UDP-N-acetylglucosamine 2-epimerase (non-hydrolyzing) [Gluconobacter sp. R75629]|uniref:non-hydrolyzing UDP-N-acetylglucosamine 2-epimerase n=1 Tax=unclassified Gluconobacter TaxID=2644261 RepID=UPI00188593BD|nr:UDP-N-acetylglucosamine 2-epimerase (non-hydrolyzing) [Gluconobacter sp. R75628]MBF0874836.1 UDP-N-acetylglucosamine 2-epimerase (non-hydrolyzing) [Gluconobacter sp. R75629]
MINIAFIIGTRPEIVKCAPLYAALQEDKNFCPRIIATGQHREMADETFEAFGIIPQINLGIMRAGQSLTQVTQRALEGLDATVVPGELDAVIVHGDTASTLAGAIYAFQNRIPLIHVEAGLRSHHAGSPFPEEANRKLVGQIANLHLAPTEGARANLLREGIHSDAIFVTGNTVVDALQNFISNNRTPRSEQIEFIVSRQKPIIIASAHRREGWHDLAEVASALREIARLNDVSLVVPLGSVAQFVHCACRSHSGLCLT